MDELVDVEIVSVEELLSALDDQSVMVAVLSVLGRETLVEAVC